MKATRAPRLPLEFPGGPELTLLQGDCREVLAGLEAGSVHCCITSPPYFGLRDYGCEGQIGLEASLEAYVEELVGVFRQVWRVLRDDATCWVNLGDSYAGAGYSNGFLDNPPTQTNGGKPKHLRVVGFAPKNLLGVPWRVAFALQADGWYLRSSIIWSKPNPMPESVTDRPTTAHEYVFLLAKRERYFYDAEAVREEVSPNSHGNSASFRAGLYVHEEQFRNGDKKPREAGEVPNETGRRNRRTVWEITPEPVAFAHFATFPQKLVEPCLLAGTSAKGVCGGCGSPWRRVVERQPMQIPERQRSDRVGVEATSLVNDGDRRRAMNGQVWAETARSETLGWKPGCSCDVLAVPATVLDPFAGSGTVGVVAAKQGRSAVLIELNPDYLALARERLEPWLAYRNGNGT